MENPGIASVGIVGGGFMGSGIAEVTARGGMAATVFEPERAALDSSRARVERSVGRAVGAGKLDAAEAAGLLERIAWTDDLDALAGSEAVIEAVVEDVAVKREVFERVDAVAPDATLLASNTSSIPIAELASATTRPDRVCGLHFFSPVPVMRLVEIVVALDTSLETITLAEGLSGQLGKHSIRTKDRAGFVVNFLLVPYLMAGVRMLEDGFATREDIDEGMRLGCGHPMGPLTLCDMIGLDVLESVCDSLYDEFKRPEYAPPALLRRMVAAGRYGRKSGRGFYDYDPARERTTA